LLPRSPLTLLDPLPPLVLSLPFPLPSPPPQLPFPLSPPPPFPSLSPLPSPPPFPCRRPRRPRSLHRHPLRHYHPAGAPRFGRIRPQIPTILNYIGGLQHARKAKEIAQRAVEGIAGGPLGPRPREQEGWSGRRECRCIAQGRIEPRSRKVPERKPLLSLPSQMGFSDPGPGLKLAGRS